MPASDPHGAARRAATDELLKANSAALAAAPRRGAPIDPSRTEVFRPGPDGKLQPIPGWTTTGPFDFGRWSKNINWPGVGRDLASIAANSLAWGAMPGLPSRMAVLGATGEGLTAADGLALGGAAYAAGDNALQDVAPRKPPKHW